MHTSFFKAIAGSLAALALGVSVANTPALARGGGFHGGFGGYYGGYGYCGYGYGYYGYYGYGNCFAY
jgi:hypothetical protein